MYVDPIRKLQVQGPDIYPSPQNKRAIMMVRKRDREVAVLNRPDNSSTGQINGKQTMINQTSLFYHHFNRNTLSAQISETGCAC